MSKPTPKNEPVAYIGAAISAALVALTLVVHVDQAQWARLIDLAPFASSLVARFFVTPAGRSVADQLQAALADANGRQAEAAKDLAELQQVVAAILPPTPAPAPVVEPAPVEPAGVPVPVAEPAPSAPPAA